MKRVFLIVLDSFGIGSLPDAEQYGDAGSNTLATCFKTGKLRVPNMQKLGLFQIDGVEVGTKAGTSAGAFGRLAEKSAGKDTTTGHWEMAGIISKEPMPVYPQGFPEEVIREFTEKTGYEVLCNLPYSGTQVIQDYGQEHLKTGKLIVYTSADSVFQIAAHESLIPPEKLYEICRTARSILQGKHAVGRVIARPFEGEYPNFKRTARRHDFSLVSPRDTILDVLQAHGLDTLAVGKINDIFAGKGVSEFWTTQGNRDGMEKTLTIAERDFHGLCFVNLVDFDMLYGHRNDPEGYTNALNEFDTYLGLLEEKMGPEDVIMITADHGCDPGFPGTDHTREYVPWLIEGAQIRSGCNLGTDKTFADIAATIAGLFGLEQSFAAADQSKKILK